MAGWPQSTVTQHQHQLWRTSKLIVFLIFIFLLIQRQPHGGTRAFWECFSQPLLGWHSQMDGPSHHNRGPNLQWQQCRLSSGRQSSTLAQVLADAYRNGCPIQLHLKKWHLREPAAPPQSRLGTLPGPEQPVPHPTSRLPDSLQTPNTDPDRPATERWY